MLPVATAIHHGVCFKVTALCCDWSQRQDLEDLFDEDGEFLQKNVICSRIVENNALLEKLRNPRKKGRRRSTYCFEREFKGLLNAEFLANFRLSRAAFS